MHPVASPAALAARPAFVSTAGLKRFTRTFLTYFLFFIAAASTLDAQLREWSLREEADRFGLTQIIEGSADKPWAFRILVPKTVVLLHDNLPQSVRRLLSNERIGSKIAARYWKGDKRGVAFSAELNEYYVLFASIMFAAYLGMLLALRTLTTDLLGRASAYANLAPLGFALLLPLTFIGGSYFYDPVELFFFSTFALALIRTRILVAAALVFFATLNKETGVLLPFLFSPLVLSRHMPRAALKQLIFLQTVALCAYVLVRVSGADNPAGFVEHHLASNLEFWQDWRAYTAFFGAYNAVIPVPRGLNVITLALVGLLLALNRHRDWPVWCLMIATLVSLPLFLLFCLHDELRNLSFMFVPMYLVLVRTIERLWIDPPETV